MAETPNYKLYVTPPDDTSTNLIEWLQMVNGTPSGSNMMKLDAILASLDTKKANVVVESSVQPAAMNGGDEWDRLL